MTKQMERLDEEERVTEKFWWGRAECIRLDGSYAQTYFADRIAENINCSVPQDSAAGRSLSFAHSTSRRIRLWPAME